MLILFTVDGSVYKYGTALFEYTSIYTITRRQENLSCSIIAGVFDTWV
jgi:hypothetical protein